MLSLIFTSQDANENRTGSQEEVPVDWMGLSGAKKKRVQGLRLER